KIRSFTLAASFAAVLAAVLAGCGGAEEESPPKPLSYHLDDMHIAGVPLNEKQAVIQAKQDYDVAQYEHSKAESDYNDVGTKIEIATNEAKQAELAEKSARTEKSAADKGADMTRQNNANRDLHNAQLGHEAASAKLDFLRAKRSWLKKWL